MKRVLFLVLFSLSLAAVIISLLWLLHDRTFEPGISLIVSIASLLALYQAGPEKRKIKPAQQSIKNVLNSGIIQQAGRDIKQ